METSFLLMNKQLLEDIGQSQFPPLNSSPQAAGEGQVCTERQHVAEPARPEPPSSAAIDFNVWRHAKAPDPAPEPPPAPAFNDRPDPLFTFTPAPDVAPAFEPPTWFDRWGRRAAITTISFVGVALVCFGAFSVYQDRTDEKTLLLLADTSPHAQAKAPPAVKAVVPPPAPEVSAPAKAPLPAAPAAAPEPKAPELVLLAPDPAPEPEPVPPKKVRPRVKAAFIARAPERSLDDARAMSPFSAMLKECRALGYHTEQCIKRACVLTKYGLACKG
jgi:hypothetical protein